MNKSEVKLSPSVLAVLQSPEVKKSQEEHDRKLRKKHTAESRVSQLDYRTVKRLSLVLDYCIRHNWTPQISVFTSDTKLLKFSRTIKKKKYWQFSTVGVMSALEKVEVRKVRKKTLSIFGELGT